MKFGEIAKVVGGIAIGQLQDHYIPFKYEVAKLELVRTGLGIAQVGLAVLSEEKVKGITKDFVDMLGVAGASLIVRQLAKFAGIASSSPSPGFGPVYTQTVTAEPKFQREFIIQ